MAQTSVVFARYMLIAFVFHRPGNVSQCRGEGPEAATKRRKRLVGARKRECHDPRVEHFRLAKGNILILANTQVSN